MKPNQLTTFTIRATRSLRRRIRYGRRRLRLLVFALRGGRRFGTSLPHPALITALGTKRRRSHVSDHLGALFFFAVDAAPRLMVELGTRDGESTRSLLAAASVTDATLLSIDIDDLGHLDLPFAERWHFVHSDDVSFGRSGFREWCREHSLAPEVDLLFVDTSHTYEHTSAEIAAWSPHLSERAILIFHDTNMGAGYYARADGSLGLGFDNQRGVIRALEDLVGRHLDERTYFSDLAGGYLITHYPACNGLAVLKRQPPASAEGSQV